MKITYLICIATVLTIAKPALAGDHLIYERYSDTLTLGNDNKVQLKTVKRIKVADAEGVPLAYREFAISYPQSAARRKKFSCDRRDVQNKSDSYFRMDLTKVNVSSGNYLTDEVYESPGFSKVLAGDVLECESVVEYDDMQFVPAFMFDDTYPVTQRLVEISGAGLDDVTWRSYNGDMQPRREAGKIVWALGPLPALPQRYPGQNFIDQARYIRLSHKRMNFYGTHYPVSTWAEIAGWVKAISAPVQKSDEALLAEVKRLTEGAKTERQKASRIYDWVRDDHRYVAVELGKNGWVPHAPVEVAKNKYGDCKDFANLFVTMARAAGLKTALVDVNTTRNGPVPADFPKPFSFDHQIAAVWLDGGWVYADATHKHLALGLLRDDVEGTRALLMPDDGEASLVDLPVSSADDNQNVWKLDARLQGGKTTLSGTNSRKGAAAGDFRSSMDSSDSTADLYNNMQRWLARRFPGGQELKIAGNYLDVHKPIKLEFSATLGGLQQVDDGRRYVRLLPLQFEEDVASGKPVPGVPIYLDRQISTLVSVDWTLESPAAVVVPEPQNIITPFGYFRLSVEKTATGLHLDREFAVIRRSIQPDEFAAYKAFILKAQELHNQYFDLGPAPK